MSYTANFIHAAIMTAPWLLGVSIALLFLRCVLVLHVLASVSADQLFPLDVLLGFSGGSLLDGLLCVLDPIVHFGVLFWALPICYISLIFLWIILFHCLWQ